MSQIDSSQELRNLCTKSLKQYLREALELEVSENGSEKTVNITINPGMEIQEKRDGKQVDKKKMTTPHFIEWQSPIVEWLNPLREWQVRSYQHHHHVVIWYQCYIPRPLCLNIRRTCLIGTFPTGWTRGTRRRYSSLELLDIVFINLKHVKI